MTLDKNQSFLFIEMIVSKRYLTSLCPIKCHVVSHPFIRPLFNSKVNAINKVCVQKIINISWIQLSSLMEECIIKYSRLIYSFLWIIFYRIDSWTAIGGKRKIRQNGEKRRKTQKSLFKIQLSTLYVHISLSLSLSLPLSLWRTHTVTLLHFILQEW